MCVRTFLTDLVTTSDKTNIMYFTVFRYLLTEGYLKVEK